MACRRDLVRFLFGNRLPEARFLGWLNEFVKQGLFARIKSDPTIADEAEALKALHETCKDGKPLAEYTVANFGGQRGSPNRLNLTTIHSAKGLEYDVVIMMGLEQGRIPYYRVTERQEKEARRLFYVAMTRARHEVHLLWSGWYIQKGNRYSNGRSKFVDEVMSHLIDT
jgi:DNA helicase-2/ATP-dependent DNA helicase PcrA